jgi:CDP-glycerol glycerophosphotransferase (TagB/SpsB family)
VMAEEMLAWAAEDDGVEFVFMPHPALIPFTASPDSPVSRADLDEWLVRWRALPNTAVLTDGDYAPVLAASDLMITDGLSMLVEYQLLEKPLVFVERAGHRPFNPTGEIVRTGAHPVAGTAAARALTERFLAGEPDPLRARQGQNVARLFGHGRAAERIVEAVREAIEAERGTRSDAGRRTDQPAPTTGQLR